MILSIVCARSSRLRSLCGTGGVHFHTRFERTAQDVLGFNPLSLTTSGGRRSGGDHLDRLNPSDPARIH